MSAWVRSIVLFFATAWQVASAEAAVRNLTVGGGDMHVTLSADRPDKMMDVFLAPTLTASSGDWSLVAAYVSAEGRSEWIHSLELPEGMMQGFFFFADPAEDLNENGIPDARERLLSVYDLPPEQRARWARAGMPDIPDYANVLNAMTHGAKGDGVTDDYAALNTLINNAPPESVIYLPAGVYRVTKTLYLKPQMILRGDGPDLTSLRFEGSGSAGRCIGVTRWDSQQTHPRHDVATDALQGEDVVVLASVSGLAVGDWVEIDMENDPAWNLNESWQQRLAGQIGRIRELDTEARRVVLERPLRHDFYTARSASLRKLHVIGEVGIEDLYVERKDAVNSHTIEFKYAVHCWVRRVYSYKTYKAHVWFERSHECTVRDSYFRDAHVFGGGTQGYGVAATRHSSDILVENNIFNRLRHSMIVESGANGNVYGYNASTNRALDPVSGRPQADISVHGNYVFMNLFEGNVLEDADVPDWFWPAGPGNTLFRNRIVNSGTAIDVGSDNQNILGNELPAGTIRVATDVRAIQRHGNVEQGTVGWQSVDCQNLPDSLYRSVPPAFFSYPSEQTPWPPFGPDRATTDGMNPAGIRLQTGDYFGGL